MSLHFGFSFVFCCIFFLAIGYADTVTDPSFSSPLRPDSKTASLPGWSFSGSTIIMPNYVRLTSDAKDASGIFFTTESHSLTNFEVSFEFRIHSNNVFGADGLVFWLSDQLLEGGPVFGVSSTWKGAAVVMDTYDNDATGQHPFVSLHGNDGTKLFQFEHDGSETYLGGCPSKYRNVQRASKVYLAVYNQKAFMYHDATGDGNWFQCAGHVDLTLPRDLYFTFSAATGGLSDNHDIHSFMINSLDDHSNGIHNEVQRPPVEVLGTDIDALPFFKTKPNPPPAPSPPEKTTPEEPKNTDNSKKNQKRNANQTQEKKDCVMFGECLNLSALTQTLSENIGEVEEQLGHSTLEIQNQISDNIKRIESSLRPLASKLAQQKNVIQSFDQKVKDHAEALTSLKTEKPGRSSKDIYDSQVKKLSDTVTIIHRTLSQVQKELGNQVQTLSIRENYGGSTDIWAIVAVVLCIIQLLIVAFNCFGSRNRRKTMPF